MNQDQVKAKLLQLDDEVEEFSVVFSGKTSRKANGVYHPESREIIIHNRNFDSDNALMYTAIHEFAHHVHFSTSPVPVGPRAHTVEFRSILHRLLARSEELGIYTNPFETDPEFRALTARLRSEFLERNGRLMKDFGAALIEAEHLCQARGVRFEDYLERVLTIDRTNATTLMKIHSCGVHPSLGYHNMATVARLASEEQRRTAEEAFRTGHSPDMVKTAVRQNTAASDPVATLQKERKRILRTIGSLQSRLEEIEQRIERIDAYGVPDDA